jgi:CheY-like chemotaxis protein
MTDTVTSLNLLIVEDEVLIALSIEDTLLSSGHVIVGIAGDVASALDLARSSKIDLALCDVRLAKGDSGIDVASRLADQGIPVVYLSGNCPPHASHALVLGCISKPFQTAALHSAVVAAYQIANGARHVDTPRELTLFR